MEVPVPVPVVEVQVNPKERERGGGFTVWVCGYVTSPCFKTHVCMFAFILHRLKVQNELWGDSRGGGRASCSRAGGAREYLSSLWLLTQFPWGSHPNGISKVKSKSMTWCWTTCINYDVKSNLTSFQLTQEHLLYTDFTVLFAVHVYQHRWVSWGFIALESVFVMTGNQITFPSLQVVEDEPPPVVEDEVN